MNLITAENISKSYSEKQLLNNINIGINDGDKIGLIGINGAGKTTLLKIISGNDYPDTGKVQKGNSIEIGFLEQNPVFDSEATVLEQVFKGNSKTIRLVRDYEKVISEDNGSQEEIIRLSHEIDIMGLWSLESEAKSVLTKLGIFNFNDKVGTLSGGQRKRIALAAALITPSDVLILDEPTNHLDNETIDWLEQYLLKRKGALLMITHDRYFLDRVVNQIIELDEGSLFVYKGNYSDFLSKKIEREEIEASTNRKKQTLLKNELEWIKKGAKARSTKQKARIERFDKLSEENLSSLGQKLDMSFSTSRLGKKVIEVENINKEYNNKKVIDSFCYILQKYDRIGIIGPNGCGKSTLINILCQRVEPDNGKVEIGETVKIGVYTQENYHIDDNLRVIDYIKEGAEYLTTANGYKVSASQMLERFLFPPVLQWTPIGRLSGGEKRRLYLLRVLMEDVNVLLLDEPTNDMDIDTLTILEEYLEEFKGAVVIVSHDRYFLDRTVDQIFVFYENGKIEKYTGNYTDYKESILLSQENDSDEQESLINKKNATVTNSDTARTKEKPLKFSYKEQREYDEIDNTIAELEDKILDIELEIGKVSTDYTLLQQLIAKKQENELLLDEKMERWVYLNELAEKIEANRKI